jgi:hypothetical protein
MSLRTRRGDSACPIRTGRPHLPHSATTSPSLLSCSARVHPALSPPYARVQIQAALMIANDVARIHHLRQQVASTQAVAALCDQMLALPQAS